jgi:predicted 2-oxoglutarate/Fe(II)-dependent dioxygenase YbiX
MPAHAAHPSAFPPAYLRSLKRQIRASPHFTTNTLNRDFVHTRGFSVVFRSEARSQVQRAFPFFAPFLERALRADCNAFYLNPLQLERGSRVDPHIDRSLRSYCKEVSVPLTVSVLYVEVPEDLRGGELVLARGKKRLACLRPVTSTLVFFDGDLTHSIEPMESEGTRLSLVCEQYSLAADELERIPSFAIETRARTYD